MPSKQNPNIRQVCKAIGLIKYPIITEKTVRLAKEVNKYCFVVDKKADKYQIKVGIEELFDVIVSDVNTTTLPRYGYLKKLILQNQARYKKAIITLKPGNDIKIFDQN